jgi:hypothetical protein
MEAAAGRRPILVCAWGETIVTDAESTEIRALRNSIDAHRSSVDQFMGAQQERCKHCESKVSELDLDINGRTPPDMLSPGLKESVRSLGQSRDTARRDLRLGWAAFVAVLGMPHIWGWLMAAFKGK